jgi:hypothetical protein
MDREIGAIVTIVTVGAIVTIGAIMAIMGIGGIVVTLWGKSVF